MKRRVWAAVIVALGLLIGVSFYSSIGGENDRASAKRIALGSDSADLWPVARSWVWTVDPLAGNRRVGLCVRTTESKIKPGTSPAFPLVPGLPAEGVERHSSAWILLDGERVGGRVTCQVIDFREAGLGEAAGKQPLRLLVRLQMGGGLIGISGADSVLSGETLAGASEIQPRWVNNDLHLLNIYTRTGDTLYAHYVMVQQREDKP